MHRQLALALLGAFSLLGCHANEAVTVRARHTEAHTELSAAQHGCCADARSDGSSTRHVAAELRDTIAAFEAAERALDADALIAFLAPDFHMLQDGKRVDYAGTVQQMRATLPTLRSFAPRFDDVQVIPLSPDLALTSLIFHDRYTTGDGQQVATWGPSTMLWKRYGERWLMTFADSDHYPEGVGGG